ncbi:MAG: glycosyltransferase family 2 protein [Lachnospiraceae bacterium]|nr:glycosyltransferase family 2 protein [Lachnospiraceae bacterium]
MIEILLATYNGEKYLSKQLDSLLGQSYSDFHIFIRDDGSSDGTVSVINDYVTKNPDKITFIHDNKLCKSPMKNFMALLEYATADYVMFCDQDDYWYREKIVHTYNEMKSVEKDSSIPTLVFTNYKVVNENLEPMKVNEKNLYTYKKRLNLSPLLVQNVVTGCTMMINKALYKNLTETREDIIMHDWWCALYASSFGMIKYLPEKTLYYRQHPGNSEGAIDLSNPKYYFKHQTIKKAKTSMKRYLGQANAFLEIFGPSLEQYDYEKYQILKRFADLKNKNKLVRMYTILRYHHTKSNFLLTILQLWFC